MNGKERPLPRVPAHIIAATLARTQTLPQMVQWPPESMGIDTKGRVTMNFNNHPGSIIGKQLVDVGNGKVEVVLKGKKREREELQEPIFVECPLPTDQDIVIPEDAPEGTPSCVICTVNAPSCVILPCMHKIFVLQVWVYSDGRWNQTTRRSEMSHVSG